MKNLELVKHVDDKGAVDEYILLEEYPEIDYALLKRDTTFQPYIVAWQFNKEGCYWSNGNYFQDLLSAMKYIYKRSALKNIWHHVLKINDNIICCYSTEADYEYVIRLEEEKDLDKAIEIAEEELEKWGAVSSLEGTDEYDYYYNAGYVEVVENAFEKANIEAEYFVPLNKED